MPALGKTLVIAGVLLIVAGALLWWSPRIPWLGRLPGDILINRRQVTVYVPLATSLVLSVVISLILWLWSKR